MKQFVQHHKTPICVALGIVFSLLLLLIGAVVGIQFFYEEFVTAKTSLKETLGIVTEADLALLAAQEEAAAQVSQTSTTDADEASETADETLTEEETAALAEQEAETAAYIAERTRTITINGYETEFNLMSDTFTWFDTAQMSTLTTNTFEFGDFSGYDVWFEGQAVAEGDVVEIDLDQLSVVIGLELKVYCYETDTLCYYYIRTLHSSYPISTAGEGTGDGYYYFDAGSTIYKMDTSGNVVFYRDTGAEFVRDFKQTIVDGVTYYSYLEHTTQGDDTVGAVQFKGVILNDQYQVIDTIDYLYTQEGMPEQCSLDMHELLVLGEGHYMFASYVYQVVDNVPTEICEDGIAYVQATVMQEVKDGEIVLQWNSTDYPEFYAYSVRIERLAVSSEDLYVDYMHFNSIAIDPADNNLILSFRSLSALVKIDRETGDIIWILGGEGDMFGLTDEQKMSYQHFPQILEDGTITVFDNGNDNVQTRVVEYLLDEENLTLLAFNAYQVDGFYAPAMGSSIRLDDDEALYLMGWGSSNSSGLIFSEINFETGEVLFEAMNISFVESQVGNAYRVYKSDT